MEKIDHDEAILTRKDSLVYSDKVRGHPWPWQHCAVQNAKGKHCNRPPQHMVKINRGKLIQLCHGCYESVKAGAYGLKEIEYVGEIQTEDRKQ